MRELVLLGRKVAVALDAVEQTETRLVDVELLGVLQLVKPLGLLRFAWIWSGSSLRARVRMPRLTSRRA